MLGFASENETNPIFLTSAIKEVKFFSFDILSNSSQFFTSKHTKYLRGANLVCDSVWIKMEKNSQHGISFSKDTHQRSAASSRRLKKTSLVFPLNNCRFYPTYVNSCSQSKYRKWLRWLRFSYCAPANRIMCQRRRQMADSITKNLGTLSSPSAVFVCCFGLCDQHSNLNCSSLVFR